MDIEKNIEKIRKDWPVTKEWIFLAHCGESPFPRPVEEALIEHTKGRMLKRMPPPPEKPETLRDFWESFDEYRKPCAKLIGAKTSEIGFCRATTEGLCIIASAIDWEKGDKVIVTNLNFPSNVSPWQWQKRYYDIDIKCVKAVDDGVRASDIEDAIDDHTKVVTIDHVVMANGFRYDLDELGKICEEHDIYYVVNAVQSMGALKIDVRKSKIDVLMAGGHKALLAPTGIGVLYVGEELIERFEPAYVGVWQWDIIDFMYHEFHPMLARTARRFEFGGHPNALGLTGLKAAADYINSIGIENIERRNLRLMDYLTERLEEIDEGIPPWAYWEGGKHRSCSIGIKTHRHPRRVALDLRKEKILTSPSTTVIGDRLRIAPAFYNIKEEIDKCVETLKLIDVKH